MHIKALPVTLIAGNVVTATIFARASALLPLAIGDPASRTVAAGSPCATAFIETAH